MAAHPTMRIGASTACVLWGALAKKAAKEAGEAVTVGINGQGGGTPNKPLAPPTMRGPIPAARGGRHPPSPPWASSWPEIHRRRRTANPMSRKRRGPARSTERRAWMHARTASQPRRVAPGRRRFSFRRGLGDSLDLVQLTNVSDLGGGTGGKEARPGQEGGRRRQEMRWRLLN